MTRRIPILLAAPAVLALAGCAAGPVAHDDGVDHARMAQIERAAAKTGVKVLWINAPRKAAAVVGG